MKNKLQKIFCAAALCCAALGANAQQATLMLNEINPNISSSHDLIELIAVSGGSVNGFTIVQGMSSPVLLATLPQVNVAAGDIIVVHLTPATATGAAPGSETNSRTEYANAAYSANYDNAWDFHGGAAGLTYSNRVILVNDSAGNIQDAVPFTNNGGAPAAYPGDVVNIQGQNLWNPSDCGGYPCTYSSIPTVESISVNWQSSGTSPTGKSAQRQNSADNNNNSDWTTSPQTQTWGMLNIGQAIKEEENSFVGISVFPNPATDELVVRSSEFGDNVELAIYNLLGEKVYSQQQTTNDKQQTVDVSQLPSGIYFYRITSAEMKIAFGKFAVQ